MRTQLEECGDIWCVRRVKDRYCSRRWSQLPPECRRTGL
jgi:hypothetical protein